MALLASLSATLFVGLGIFFVNYRLNRPDRTIDATRELMQLQEEMDRLSVEEHPAERSKLLNKQDRLENEIFAERRQEVSLWISWVGLLTCGVIVPFRGNLILSDGRGNIIEIRIAIGYSMLLVAGLVIWTVGKVNYALKDSNIKRQLSNNILAPVPPVVTITLVVVYVLMILWCVAVLAGWVQSGFWLG